VKDKKLEINPKHQELKMTCGAKTRSGHPCKTSPIKNRRRCRMHGCAKGSGVPKGSQNALKHGYYTKEKIEHRARITKMIKELATFSEELEWED